LINYRNIVFPSVKPQSVASFNGDEKTVSRLMRSKGGSS
jgi:hypothetical protein